MKHLEHDMKRARQCLNPFSQMMNGFDGEFFIFHLNFHQVLLTYLKFRLGQTPHDPAANPANQVAFDQSAAQQAAFLQQNQTQQPQLNHPIPPPHKVEYNVSFGF